MDLTRAALDRRVITLVAIGLVLVAGLGSFFSLSRAEDPGFIIRIAVVITYFPGASPERVEHLVTEQIEQAVQEIPELDFVDSESRTGMSVVYVNILASEREMRPIWDDLRRKVEDAADDLPEGVIGPFVNDSFGDVFGIVLSLEGDGFSYAELEVYAETARDHLLRLGDVAKIDIYGAQDERLFVEYNNARLAELALSPGQLAQILQSVNIVMPGGSVTVGRERITLEPSGNFESIADLQRTVISLPGRPESVFLEDIAHVYRGYVDPPTSLMRVNGRPSLGLAISMRESGDIIALGAQVRDVVRHLQSEFPIGIEFDEIAFQPDEVDKKVRDFVISLLQAIGIVLAVMLLFLGLRTGFVVASLVPAAMVAALLVMSLFGIGLDQMSLASLIIALGMLVDNAIVMAESIMVAMGEGKNRVEAAVQSARELRVPLLTSSLTTAAAFLPIFLAESSTGEYTAPLFKVVTITLLCSWVLSLTLIPLLCVVFIKVKGVQETSFDTRFYRLYRGALLGALKFRWLSLLVIIGAFVLAMMGFRLIPNIFFPESDKAIFTAEFELPPGTPIERTAEVVAELEAFMGEHLLAPERTYPGSLRRTDEMADGLINWGTFIGTGLPRFYLSAIVEQTRPEYAIMIGNANDRTVMMAQLQELETFARLHFPDLNSDVQPLQLGPPITAPIAIRISGDDTPLLFDLVEAVSQHLRDTPGIDRVTDNWGIRTKNLVVEIDQARAQRVGVSSQDVAISLQAYLSGIETTEYREDDDAIPVTLRSVAEDRQDIDKLYTMNVFSQATGRSVPLAQVASLDLRFQPGVIWRRDGVRTVTLEAYLTPGVTAAALNLELAPWLEQQAESWPFGFRWELGGEAETSGEANRSIGEKMPIAMMIIVMLLVWQFNSLRKPLIIMLTIPLALIGVVIGLLAARSYFGFMTLLGVISLFGIVINNAIVLIDRIQIELDQNGHEPARAVLEASQRRLRPILLTTLTTIGGLLPLWFGPTPMFEPMAIAIIFGLGFGTLLTLGVVPILYSLFFRVSFKGYRYPTNG